MFSSIRGEKRFLVVVLTGVWIFVLVLLSGGSLDWRHMHGFPGRGIEEQGLAGLSHTWGSSTLAQCPLPYNRHSIKQISHGQRPYMFGGERTPSCRHCGSNQTWSNFCRFDKDLPGNPHCGQERLSWLTQGLLDRGFHDILVMTPCDLFQHIRSRTVWIVGDSQSLDFSKALQCFLHEFWDLQLHNITSTTPNLAPFLKKLRVNQCANLMEKTRLCYLRADQAQTVHELVMPLMLKLGQPQDLLVMNVGLHYSPRYEQEVKGIANFYNKNRPQLPIMVWMDTPPQHFETTFGEYPKDPWGPPYMCWFVGKTAGKNPLKLSSDHQLTTTDPAYQSVADGGSRNIMSRPIMAAYDIPVLQTWNETTDLWNYHRDNGAGWECTHYCFPSAPQVWVHHLFVLLESWSTPGAQT